MDPSLITTLALPVEREFSVICSRTSAALARRKHVVSWGAELFDQLEFYELAFGKLHCRPLHPPLLFPARLAHPIVLKLIRGKGWCARENTHVLHCGESENAAAGEVIGNAAETAETANVACARSCRRTTLFKIGILMLNFHSLPPLL